MATRRPFLLLAVLLATACIARALGFDRADRITVLFCGSKKSLASGLPMASVLFGGLSLGLVMLPLMVFHEVQLMTCAALARRFGAAAVGYQAGVAPAERTNFALKGRNHVTEGRIIP